MESREKHRRKVTSHSAHITVNSGNCELAIFLRTDVPYGTNKVCLSVGTRRCGQPLIAKSPLLPQAREVLPSEPLAIKPNKCTMLAALPKLFTLGTASGSVHSPERTWGWQSDVLNALQEFINQIQGLLSDRCSQGNEERKLLKLRRYLRR